jgi:hypothetical protein
VPDPAACGVLLRLDGVVHAGDLAVQAFARHVAAAAPGDRGRAVLAGMRGLLEGRPDLLDAGVELAGPGLLDAEDGEQAVELLAAAAGLAPGAINTAWRAARADLAGTAWIIDPPAGLAGIVEAAAGRALLAVLTGPGDPAVDAVLDACELTGRIRRAVALPVAAALQHLLPDVGGNPGRLLMIGTRWAGELDAAHAAGAATAMVDRFARGTGHPDHRAADLAGLVDIVRSWIAAP